MAINNEYREWLISEIKTLTPDNAAQMSTYDIEKIYEAIGCLLPQSSHTKRAVLKQLYLLDDTNDWGLYPITFSPTDDI